MAFGQAFGQEEFQIPGLGSSFEYALARLDTKCNDMGGSMQLCRRVYNRFNRLRGKMVDIGRSKVQELVVFAIGNAVKDFRRLVRKQFEKPLLFRLATAQKVIDELRRIHFLLDDIYKTLQLTDDPTMTEWQEHWDSDRELQASWFVTKFKETRLREVINQIKGPQGLDDALAQLKFALEIRDRDTNILPKLREVMDKRYNDVLALQNIQGVKIFEWFIPRDDVDIEEDGVLGMGSYGSASRAKWVDSRRAAEEKGQPKAVVVKSLNLTTVETARKSFSDELTIWFGLEHRNVLKLYGACHVGSPQFFVCEYAQDGDILQFFSDPLRRPLLWDMFIQATEGLRYLHEAKQVEHGDLKCNNILVARGNVVKISDFGFAVVRNQSIGVSEKSQQDAIRYKAPEHLSQDDATRDFRKADVYSLGLCIVEAVTQEVIFGTLDEDDIMVEKMRPNHVVRPPDQFSNLEWALIASMCAFDPEKRPSTDEVIKSMDVLRKLEKDKQPDTEPDAEVLRGLEKLHIEQQEGGK